MFARILEIVIPIYAIVAVGYVYGRRKKPDIVFANRLTMDIFAPALVFAALASKSFDIMQNLHLLIGGAVVLLGAGLLSWPIASFLGVATKTFLPPMMFKNSGNMGLPLIVLAFGEQALPAAVVLFFIENTLHYSLGIWMLDHHARLTTLWRVPMIAAAIVGLAVSFFRIPIWQPLWLGIKMLGDISIPLMLFSLGVRLTDARYDDLKVSLAAAFTSPLTGIIVAWAVTPLLGFSARDSAMLILFGALPPALLNYVFAERYEQEPERVASLVMISNATSMIVIPLTLYCVL